MQHVREGYRGVSIFLGLNADRFLTTGAIAFAMMLAIWVQSI